MLHNKWTSILWLAILLIHSSICFAQKRLEYESNFQIGGFKYIQKVGELYVATGNSYLDNYMFAFSESGYKWQKYIHVPNYTIIHGLRKIDDQRFVVYGQARESDDVLGHNRILFIVMYDTSGTKLHEFLFPISDRLESGKPSMVLYQDSLFMWAIGDTLGICNPNLELISKQALPVKSEIVSAFSVDNNIYVVADSTMYQMEGTNLIPEFNDIIRNVFVPEEESTVYYTSTKFIKTYNFKTKETYSFNARLDSWDDYSMVSVNDTLYFFNPVNSDYTLLYAFSRNQKLIKTTIITTGKIVANTGVFVDSNWVVAGQVNRGLSERAFVKMLDKDVMKLESGFDCSIQILETKTTLKDSVNQFGTWVYYIDATVVVSIKNKTNNLIPAAQLSSNYIGRAHSWIDYFNKSYQNIQANQQIIDTLRFGALDISKGFDICMELYALGNQFDMLASDNISCRRLISAIDDENEHGKWDVKVVQNRILFPESLVGEQYRIYNTVGQCLMEGICNEQLNISTLQSDLYVLVLNKNDRQFVQKFLKF